MGVKQRFLFALLCVFCAPIFSVFAKNKEAALPREIATLTFAPETPPPVKRHKPALVEVRLESSVTVSEIKPGLKYAYWGFNGHVPGPMIRVRVGDTIEVHHTNSDKSGMPHNIDFHAVTGPGGGATVTTVTPGEERKAWFKMMSPGLYIYHCAAPPVMDHIANGMYGLILVEPEKGLPPVDREFYILQSEFYTGEAGTPSDHKHESKKDFWDDDTSPATAIPKDLLPFSHQRGLDENPSFVVFNGKVGSLTGTNTLKAKVGERVRIFFGNAGPNLISSFHVIGEIFENVYREGDLISPPAHGLQTTLVPAGGATVVEFGLEVPGTYTLVDHAIFRVEKGNVGFLEVEGQPNHSVYVSDEEEISCEGCLVHP